MKAAPKPAATRTLNLVQAVNEALDASRRLEQQKMGALTSLTGGLGGMLGR